MTPLQAAKTRCANYQNFDDTAKFASGDSTIGEHLCPQCELNGRSTWTQNKIFCDRCIVVRESYGFWGEPLKGSSKKKCAAGGCRRLVEGRTRYCDRCARKRKAASTRECKWRKGRKLANSPIGAEALTEPKIPIRYHHPQTSISDASFSTGGGIAQAALEDGESIDTAEQAVAQ
jgi:hypothetical protein